MHAVGLFVLPRRGLSSYRIAIDLLLHVAKPRDLPIWAAAKFEFAVNLKTAKSLGLDFPPLLLARADEVIE